MATMTAPLLADDFFASPSPARPSQPLGRSSHQAHRPRPAARPRVRQPRLLPLTRESVFGPADSDATTRPITPLDPIALSRELVRDERGVFMIEVHDDSMRDALLFEGDVVIVQQVNRVADGELAAVWLSGAGRMALRRVFFEGASVRLQPEDRQAPPEILGTGGYEIRGRVMAIVRQPRVTEADEVESHLDTSQLDESRVGAPGMADAEIAEAQEA